jgi:hypothetical protein
MSKQSLAAREGVGFLRVIYGINSQGYHVGQTTGIPSDDFEIDT